jgi:hypothetical protein
VTTDHIARLDEMGNVLAERVQGVLDATAALLESVPPAFRAARSRRYEIREQIGGGGQAEVLLGIAHGVAGFQRWVAIKRVRSEQANKGRGMAALVEEAHLASRYSHPNVVSVLTYDRDERYQTAGLAAANLMGCRDPPRHGRGELIRLLDERFPPLHRRSAALSPSSGTSSEGTGPLTLMAPLAPSEALAVPSPMEQGEALRYASTWQRVQLWWQMAACGLLFASALAAMIAFFVMP